MELDLRRGQPLVGRWQVADFYDDGQLHRGQYSTVSPYR